jgi:hypothetical protein
LVSDVLNDKDVAQDHLLTFVEQLRKATTHG